MMADQSYHPNLPAQPPRKPLALPAAAAALVGFGATMLLMALFYTRDLALLAETPGAIWSFICGVPTDNPMVLPLLVALGALALLAGAGLAVLLWLRRGQPRAPVA